MKKRKRRSVAASRAASLKAWRTRKLMKALMTMERLEVEMAVWKRLNKPTIDRIAKVEWK